jgi:ribosomal subunit interface protein
MQITIKGRHWKVSPDFREYAERRIEKLQRYFSHLISANLTVTEEGYRHQAELRIFGNGVDVTSRAQDPDAKVALDAVLEKQERALKPKERADLNRRHVGFVFQSYHLIDDLTVYENLEVPLQYRNVARKERQALVADTLDRFGIVAKKDLYPAQLSGGQQQLVGVARAVIGKPRLILADEPTGNLHSDQGREIMDLFRRLNEAGTTIVQVTHSEQNAARGHRIVQLRDGWVERAASPANAGRAAAAGTATAGAETR